MENIQELKRYKVQGIYQDIVYATDKQQAKELFCELNATCEQAEGDFDQIIVEEAPFKY